MLAHDNGQTLQGLVTIDVNASMPEFGISAGDKMLVDFDPRAVRPDGLYLVEQDGGRHAGQHVGPWVRDAPVPR